MAQLKRCVTITCDVYSRAE